MDEEADTDHVSPSSSKSRDIEHTENADETSTNVKPEAEDDEDVEDEEYSEEYLRLHPEARNERTGSQEVSLCLILVNFFSVHGTQRCKLE